MRFDVFFIERTVVKEDLDRIGEGGGLIKATCACNVT